VLLATLGLLAGAGLLVLGAEWFAGNVSAAAGKLGLSVFAVGLLLAGAEPEEAVTAVLASLDGHPALAAGDVIGANVVILALALGLAALLSPLPVSRRVKQYAGAAAVAGSLAVLVLLNGHVGRAGGVRAGRGVRGGVVVVWRRERVPPVIGEVAELFEGDDEPAGRSPAVGLTLTLAGIAFMVAGGWVAVRAAERLTETLSVTDSTVGLTVLALATSAEMLALVFAAARHRVADVAVAGMVGSAAYNATVSLGLAALARPLELPGVTAITLTAVAAAALPSRSSC
jgi:cation:H+ antiporter